MKRLLVMILVGATVLFPVSASADRQSLGDADDATGPLDIASIKQSHRTTERGSTALVHTIRLYESWTVDQLRHRGFVNVFFDLSGNEGWRQERAVYVTYEDGRLVAELFNFAADPPTFIRHLSLRRPNPRTVRFTLTRSDLRRREFGHYTWFAISFVEERHRLCGKPGGCDDHAGALRHDL